MDPAQGGPLKCVSSADCTGGWFCGAEGTCLDPALPAALPCTSNVHCTPGWRCGLEEVCHPLDAGAPYECRRDDDCEARWRCGPDNRCVDATIDALRPTGDAGAAFGARIHPTFPLQRPDAVSVVEQVRPSDCSGQTAWLDSAVLAHGRLLTKTTWFRFGGWAYDCPSDGGKAATFAGEQLTVELPAAPVEVLELGMETLAAMADGGLLKIAYTPRSPLAVSMLQANLPVAHLKVRAAPFEGLAPAVLFNSSSIALYDGTAVVQVPPLPLVDGGVPKLADAIYEMTDRIGGRLYAGTDLGLLVTDRDATDGAFGRWRHVYGTCKEGPVRQVQLARFGKSAPRAGDREQ